MLSGIGPRNHLNQFGIPVIIDLPVGNNLDIHGGLDFIPTLKNKSLSAANPELTIDNLSKFYINKTGPLARWTLLLQYINTRLNTDLDWPNILTFYYFIRGRIYFHVNLEKPRSRGTIRLQSNSPFLAPKLNTNLLKDPRDFEDMVEGVKFILYLAERTTLAQYLTIPTFESLGCKSCGTQYMNQCDEGVRCLVRRRLIIDDIGGTCRMGALERDDVVVSPLLQVKHAQNLRVCDSSIFPALTNGGPTTASMMVGEKCSQIIKDCYNM